MGCRDCGSRTNGKRYCKTCELANREFQNDRLEETPTCYRCGDETEAEPSDEHGDGGQKVQICDDCIADIGNDRLGATGGKSP